MKNIHKLNALTIQLESFDQGLYPVNLNLLMKIVNKFRKSFLNFLEIHFFRDEYYQAIYIRQPRALESLKKETDIEIIQIDIERLIAVLSPPIYNVSEMFFIDDLLEWKKKTWELYKESVVYGDFNNLDTIKKLTEEYSQDERLKILKPLTDILSYNKLYKINVLDASFTPKGILLPLHEIVKTKLLS